MAYSFLCVGRPMRRSNNGFRSKMFRQTVISSMIRWLYSLRCTKPSSRLYFSKISLQDCSSSMAIRRCRLGGIRGNSVARIQRTVSNREKINPSYKTASAFEIATMGPAPAWMASLYVSAASSLRVSISLTACSSRGCRSWMKASRRLRKYWESAACLFFISAGFSRPRPVYFYRSWFRFLFYMRALCLMP